MDTEKKRMNSLSYFEREMNLKIGFYLFVVEYKKIKMRIEIFFIVTYIIEVSFVSIDKTEQKHTNRMNFN